MKPARQSTRRNKIT